MSAETGVLVIPFDENTGTVTGDVSGNGNSGTITVTSGSPAWSASGQYGNCLNRSSANGLVTVAHAASINDLGPFTVTFWLQFTTTANGAIVYKSDGNVTAGWWIDRSASGIGIQIVHSTTNVKRYFNTGIPATGAWHHYAFTWDGTKPNTGLHIYLDGTEVTYSTNTTGVGTHATDAAVNLLLFSQTGGSSATFVGLIDQLRIYNTALNSTQIGTDKNTQINAIGTLSTTLGAATLSSAGTVAYAAITGSAAVTLGAATDSATGTVAIAATASNTLDAATLSSAATVLVTDSEATTLGAATASSAGTVLVTASASPTLGTATLSSTATDAVAALESTALDPATLSSAGAVLVQASAVDTLDAVTLDAQGVVGALAPVLATVDATLDALTCSAEGTVAGVTEQPQVTSRPSGGGWGALSPRREIKKRRAEQKQPEIEAPLSPIVAEASVTLGEARAVSAGTVAIGAACNVQLEAAFVEAVGATKIAGSVAIVLGAASCASSARAHTRRTVYTVKTIATVRGIRWPSRNP